MPRQWSLVHLLRSDDLAMRRAFANKVDSTAKDLIQQAEDLGAQYLSINGTIDGILFYRGKTLLVDWKGKRTPTTAKQQELINMGWPIHLIRTTDELIALLRAA